MSARRSSLVRRLIDDVVDIVADRAPRLSDRAYRAVSVPLHWVDPAGGARTAEARLDDVRRQVVGMAAHGRVRRAEQQRIQRSLARTREDLERLTSRLPAVRARGLALRLAGYTQALQALPGRSGRSDASSRSAGARDVLLATGVAAGAWAGLLLPAAGTAAVEGGLAAGVATAIGATAAHRRHARKEQISAIAETLQGIDEATTRPHGVDLQALDHRRDTLMRRALAAGRLDDAGTEALRRIDSHLAVLLVRLLEGDLEADTSYLVQATVSRYLPDTLEPFLALADPQALVGGRPAAVVAAEQLASLDDALADAVRRQGRNDPESLLLLQGEFLRSKFGETSP